MICLTVNIRPGAFLPMWTLEDDYSLRNSVSPDAEMGGAHHCDGKPATYVSRRTGAEF